MHAQPAMVERFGKMYPASPEHRSGPQNLHGRLRKLQHALNYAMRECPSNERRAFVHIREALAMIENSLERAKPTLIDPLTPLPWDQPQSLPFALRRTRRPGNALSMEKLLSSERALLHDCLRLAENGQPLDTLCVDAPTK